VTKIPARSAGAYKLEDGGSSISSSHFTNTKTCWRGGYIDRWDHVNILRRERDNTNAMRPEGGNPCSQSQARFLPSSANQMPSL
jgi:hypothetical protein